MAIATGTLIAMGIMAGTQVAGAAIQSKAAGNAADQQADAAGQALALQRDMYRQSRSDLAPYMSAGAGANQTLASAMGIPMAPVPDVQSSTASGAALLPDGRSRPANSPAIGTAVPRAGSTPSPSSSLPPVPGYQGDVWDPNTNSIRNTGYNVPERQAGARTAPTASGYVSMRAPDGTVAQVPAGAVDQAVARGAVRL